MHIPTPSTYRMWLGETVNQALFLLVEHAIERGNMFTDEEFEMLQRRIDDPDWDISHAAQWYPDTV